MSFLTPLYLLGALAIAAPIVFHLIRRPTRQNVPFSTLMFLTPSRPREVRRGKIDDWPLLLLRCLAFLMLAFAFARPFLRDENQLMTSLGRDVVIAMDQSASMRRESLWPRAIQTAVEVLEDLGPEDRVSIMFFDTDTRWWMSEDGVDRGSIASMRSDAIAKLSSMTPTWLATDIASALMDAAGRLASSGDDDSARSDDDLERLIVLITDAQEGADVDALRSFAWPDRVRVDVKTIAAEDDDNASLRVMPMTDESDRRLSLRVHRHGGDSATKMNVGWASDASGAPQTPPVSMQVPPRQVRTVVLPLLDSDASNSKLSRLSLRGDAHAFDNDVYFVPPKREVKRLLLVGPAPSESEDARNELGFYLERMPLDRSSQTMQFVRVDDLSDEALDPSQTPLVVLGRPSDVDEASRLREYLLDGGTVLAVMTDGKVMPGDQDPGVDWTSMLGTLFSGDTSLHINVAGKRVREAMRLATVDFREPLFASMAEPAFADFSRIQFWSHQPITDVESPWHVAATLEDRGAAMVHRDVGDGVIWLLASGWQPTESQLALSTKFIPMMHHWFWDRCSNGQAIDHIVGRPLPAGWSVESAVDRPGIHEINVNGTALSVAFNLDPSESETSVMSVDRFEQLGIPVGQLESTVTIADRQRQLRRRELENRQGLWQWLILGVLSLLAIEMWLAGRRSAQSEPLPAGNVVQ
ncbi:MAG: BatA domain-containing protein [Planctomycetota bacterium]